jgi:tRNA threonylcarbamoyladenosine biosynthesis protein TsaB
MIIAAIDTSGTRGTLAVATFQESTWNLLSEAAWDKKAMHSEVATVEFENAMKKAGLELKQLTHLAVNVGPGSFTGLRVGINMIRTLAYVFQIPVAPLSTLELLARRELGGGASANERILVATKAVQNFFYAAIFENGKFSLEPQSMEEDGLKKAAQGCTKVLIEGLTPGFNPSTEARDLLGVLGQSDAQPRFFSWAEVKPLYIRASEAEEKLRKGLLKPL